MKLDCVNKLNISRHTFRFLKYFDTCERKISSYKPALTGDSVSSNINRTKKQRFDNANSTIIGHLNINSFRKKFAFVEDITKLFHVFLISLKPLKKLKVLNFPD